MRSTTLAAFTVTTLALIACGGEQPAPQPPPSVPPPTPVASASAPTPDTTPPPPPKPSLADLVPQTLKGIGDAFNAHDAKKVASYYTEDCAVQSYGTPEREGHSRDDVAKTAQSMFDAFGDPKAVVTRVWTKANIAVTEIVWAGTMTGDFMGVKASKKAVGQTRLHVIWFNDDGLVKEEHEYGDGAGLMAQMKGAKGAPPVPTIPSGPPEMHVSKGAPEEDKLADGGKKMDETFNKDDVKAVVATVADDADYWVNISGGPATKGKKDLTKDLTNWFKAFPDSKWTSNNSWGIDGYEIVEHTMSGTQKGPMGPLPASNKPVTNWHWVDIIQPTADGKMQHGWGFANLLEMMSQTGAMKPPPGEKAAAKADTAKGMKADAPKMDAKDPGKKK
jgi:steroid delta-isomerase-like uncharacterized protein